MMYKVSVIIHLFLSNNLFRILQIINKIINITQKIHNQNVIMLFRKLLICFVNYEWDVEFMYEYGQDVDIVDDHKRNQKEISII